MSYLRRELHQTAAPLATLTCSSRQGFGAPAADQREENIARFPKAKGDAAAAVLPDLTPVRGIIPGLFGLTFAIMPWGGIAQGWRMGQMSILVWIVG